MSVQQIMVAQNISAGPPPGGFPVVESITSEIYTSSNTVHAIAYPATVNASDLLVMSLADEAGQTISTPSGWTSQGNLNDTGGGGMRQYVFTKVAAGTEGGTTFNVTLGATGFLVGAIIRVSNCTTTGTYFAKNSKLMSTASTTPANLTPAWGALDTLWLNIASGYYDYVPTGYPLPDDHTHINHGVGLYSVYVSTKKQNTATLTSSAITFSGTQYGTMFTMGIKPV